MRSILRLLLVWLVVAALPVQGVAAVALTHCRAAGTPAGTEWGDVEAGNQMSRPHVSVWRQWAGAGHERHDHAGASPADAVAHAPDSHRHASPESADGHAAHDVDPHAPTDAEAVGLHGCSACAACCVSAAPPRGFDAIPALPIAALPPPSAPEGRASFVTPGPERPPRLPLA